MKKLFSLMMLFVATVLTNNAFAQGSLLATLNHEGTISTYYGAQAWKNAHDAAVNGDVITLSSGTFVAVNITKAITVRGAGMGIDTTAVVDPTVISGDFTIDIADSVANRLTLEGIYSNHTIIYNNVVNPLFLKCRLNVFRNYSSSTVLKDASFIHCRISGRLSLGYNSSISCVNSVIRNPYSYDDSTSNFEFLNCVIVSSYTSHTETSHTIINTKSSSFKNCILCTFYYNDYVNGSSTAYNCVGLGTSSMFRNITNSTNKYVSKYATIFKTYTGADIEKRDSEEFRLTEDAKTQYLGTDGTEVGIYGGSLPFDPTPSNPQITKCNVAAKSTADGKLSVDIEVNAAE
ncbi:MAG: hypothetical protein ACI4BA_04365 [Prevotella sp.]